MDNFRRINVPATRAMHGLLIIMNGRMAVSASGAQLNVLQAWGIDAGIWAHFVGKPGSRHTLVRDEEFQPSTLTDASRIDTATPEERIKRDAERESRRVAKKEQQARFDRTLSFPTGFNAALPPSFC